jgi:predicted nucleotidyltransferase
MKLHDVEIDERKLTEFCQKNAIRELLFFGSIARDDFRPDSDIDVIVNFEPGRTPDLFTFAGLQLELGQMLGRQVHLHTDEMIHPYLRRRIRGGAKVGYAA